MKSGTIVYKHLLPTGTIVYKHLLPTGTIVYKHSLPTGTIVYRQSIPSGIIRVQTIFPTRVNSVLTIVFQQEIFVAPNNTTVLQTVIIDMVNCYGLFLITIRVRYICLK